MKLSDYVVQFFVAQGIKETFVLTGGCVVHLIDSVANNENINYLPVQHEQAGSMAADAYARVTGNIGVAMATSGPGATNFLTGVCSSYYDSIPVVMITGQVPVSQLKRESASRQIGFQETDVVSIFKPVTKYAALVDKPEDIRYELEKAFYLAKEGRPGPVLLDICDDVQRAEIQPENLRPFIPPVGISIGGDTLEHQIDQLIEMINLSERPVFIFGGGIRLADVAVQVQELVRRCLLPFTLTWAAMDCVDNAAPLYVGGFGVTAGRPGNFAVQNADLIVAIGTRLDTHVAGTNLKTFGRAAKKVVVDIDHAEQEKYAQKGMFVDLLITRDAREVVGMLLDKSPQIVRKARDGWLQWIERWKRSYPICLENYRLQSEKVNPYVFMEQLSCLASDDAIVIPDTGSNLIWTMQAFKAKSSQRVFSAFNHTPMGYSLPASIGAALAAPNRQIICITGDGGLQINVQELATIQRHSIDIKIFVMNNHGHGIIQGTQDNWLKSRHHASNPLEGGLPDPDYCKVAEA
ncbi:MAG: hypothetical protein RIR18_2399, partial [Pseudomonadota bacterium]